MAQGIEFLLQLQAKLDGATQMVHALTNVERAVGKSHRAVVKHEGELHQLSHWFKELGKEATKTFTGMFAAEAVWDSLKEGVHVVGDLVSEMLKAGGEAQRTELAFANMLGHQEGERLIGNLERFSDASEFTSGPVKAFAQELLDAGFAGQSLNLAMAAVSDTAARSPNKMEGAQNAISALSQAMLTGTLDARALRRLRLQPKAVFKQMATDLGMGQKEVEKKLQEGKIRQEDVINSLFKAIAAKGGGVLGKVGADMAGTFGAKFEKFKDIIPTLFEKTGNSPGLNSLGDSLERVTKMFAPDSPLGKSIITGLAGGMNAFANAIGRIDAQKLSETLISLFDRLPGLIEKSIKVVDTFVTVLSKLASLYEYTLVGQIIKDKFFTNHSAPGEQGHRTALNALGPPAGQVSPEDFIRGVFKPPSASTAADSGNQVGGAFSAGVVGGAEKGLAVHSPSREFERLGQMSARGYQDGLEMAPPSLSARAFLGGAGTPAGGGRAITINAPVNVSVADTQASAAEIAEAVRRESQRGLLAALEDLGLVGGTA